MTSLKVNKGRSGRIITTRTQENVEVVRQASEKNQGRISARRNELGVLPSSFCRVIKKDLTHTRLSEAIM